MKDELLAVIEAAREWNQKNGRDLGHLFDRVSARLSNAAMALEAKLKEPQKVPWWDVRAADFVQTPKGDWLEVVQIFPATDRTKRHVILKIGGLNQDFQYPAENMVTVRRAQPAPVPGDAIAALVAAFSGTEVIEERDTAPYPSLVADR